MITLKEQGWPAHFIEAHKCFFRRNTLLEKSGRSLIVSTIGHKITKNGVETIGYGRYYETMAFMTVEKGGYKEADISKPVPFESPYYIENFNRTTDHEANEMHEEVVSELFGE